MEAILYGISSQSKWRIGTTNSKVIFIYGGELTEEGSRSIDFTAVGSTTPATKEWNVFH